jgi:hypothetical protein
MVSRAHCCNIKTEEIWNLKRKTQAAERLKHTNRSSLPELIFDQYYHQESHYFGTNSANSHEHSSAPFVRFPGGPSESYGAF